MRSEEDDILSRGFDGEIPDAPLERRRKRPDPAPGGRDRRRRARARSRLPILVALALLLHALPVVAAWWARPELLGFSAEGGSGWEFRGIQWEGVEGLPPGPPAQAVEAAPPDPRIPEEAPAEAAALPSAEPATLPDFGSGPAVEGGGGAPAGPLPEASIPRRPAARAGGGGPAGPVRGEGGSLGSVGETLEPVWNPRPAYPSRARDLGQEGEVLLELAVGPDGKVLRVRVVRTSGWELLDRAAVDAVSRWRYAPGMTTGEVLRTLEVDFRLEEAR